MRIEIKGTKYADGPAIVKKDAYGNNRIALQLVSPEDGEPICIPTVNLEEYAHLLAPTQTFIKDWAENEGILKALQDAQIVGPVLFERKTGFCFAQAVEVLV